MSEKALIENMVSNAAYFVIDTQRCTASSLQRKFRVGYCAAIFLIEKLEEKGVVSEHRPNGRAVLKNDCTGY